MRRRLLAGTLFWLTAAAVLAGEGRPAEVNAAQVMTIGPYNYDGSGNIKSIGPNQSQTFVYDAFGRITSGTVAGQSQTYTYDRFGNLLTMTTDGSAVTLGVDPGGSNRMNQSSASAWGQYDAAGRMVASSSSGTTSTFAYDAAGMVRQATVGGVTKFHVYSASDERIASITVSNGAEVRSDWTIRDSSGRVLRRLERNGGVWAWREDYIYRGGQLLASEVDTPTGTQHFHVDHLGTPRLITGKGGVEVSRHTYYPFGQELERQTAEKQKFTGHERDFGSGAGNDLDYMHARYYAVAWGRFLSPDPGGFYPERPQSWNRYAYTSNNPVNKVDPDGRDEVGFGKQTVTVFTGEVLVVSSPSGGLHVATYVKSGPEGEVLVYDNTSARNQDLSGLTPRTTRSLTDNTGNNHRIHNLAAPTVNNKPNAFSPAQGATILGVVHTSRKVGVGELAKVAPSVKMFHQSNADGNKQCTDFVKALADAAGYKLLGIGAAKKTTEFTTPEVLDKSVVRIGR